MAREFNPTLFGEEQLQEKIRKEVSGQSIEMIKRKIRELESQNLKMTQKLEKMTLTMEQRNMQWQHALRGLEAQSKAATQELSRKMQALMAKFTERRMAEARTQELIDRHNQLVQNFEVRMSQMQKVTSELEMKLLTK